MSARRSVRCGTMDSIFGTVQHDISLEIAKVHSDLLVGTLFGRTLGRTRFSDSIVAAAVFSA